MCFLVCALLVAPVSVSAQKSKSPDALPVISLAISARQNSARVGSPIRVEVALENKSGHEIAITRELRGRDCRVEVRDLNGKLAADTKLGRVWNRNTLIADPSQVSPEDLKGNLIQGRLKSGEKLMWEFDAATLYEIIQPGKYTIEVERRDPESPSIIVKSNTINVTVTP